MPSSEHVAEFSITSPSAEILYLALLPEVLSDDQPRSKISCRLLDTNLLVITVTAADIPAVRASLNLWLRLAGVAEEMHDIVSRQI